MPIILFKTGFHRHVLTYKTEWILAPDRILKIDYNFNNKIIGKIEMLYSPIIKIELGRKLL